LRLGRIRYVVFKEFIHVLRDPRLRTFLFLPPLIQLLTYGYAVNFDIKHIDTAIYDQSRTAESRELISRFGSTEYFHLAAEVQDEKQLADLIDRGKVTMAVRIHPDFAKRLKEGNEPAPVQIIIDGTDSNAALVVAGYAGTVINNYSQEVVAERMRRQGMTGELISPIVVDQRAWFNPNLISRYSFVPGVIAMVVMLVSLMLTAMAVVREKELGTMEQIMVTPLLPSELILGKTIPFVLIALFDVALVVAVGVFWFEVPMRGSIAVLLLGTILFLFNSVGLGLFISTVSSTQQQAMMASSFFFTPAILLSGFVFPISNMPTAVQYVTYLNPLRYFIVVIQDIFLKGVGLSVLWPQMVGMAVLGVSLLSLSVLRFRKRVA
jgi:ABC-2 type transport system permease protein